MQLVLGRQNGAMPNQDSCSERSGRGLLQVSRIDREVGTCVLTCAPPGSLRVVGEPRNASLPPRAQRCALMNACTNFPIAAYARKSTMLLSVHDNVDSSSDVLAGSQNSTELALKREINGAEGETRTRTGIRPLPPQGSVSTNFTTSA